MPPPSAAGGARLLLRLSVRARPRGQHCHCSQHGAVSTVEARIPVAPLPAVCTGCLHAGTEHPTTHMGARPHASLPLMRVGPALLPANPTISKGVTHCLQCPILHMAMNALDFMAGHFAWLDLRGRGGALWHG